MSRSNFLILDSLPVALEPGAAEEELMLVIEPEVLTGLDPPAPPDPGPSAPPESAAAGKEGATVLKMSK